jgi:hypothetical protein
VDVNGMVDGILRSVDLGAILQVVTPCSLTNKSPSRSSAVA